MTKRLRPTQFQSRTILLTMLAALVTAGPALPQSATSNAVPGNAATRVTEGGYSLVDFSVFFGTQWYQIFQGSGGAGNHFFETRPVFGERVTENFSRYVSLEENFSLGFNRLALLPQNDPYVTVNVAECAPGVANV